MSAARRRIERLAGRYSLADTIPFRLPVMCRNSPALAAVFPCDAEAVAKLLPGSELLPFRLWN